MSYETNDMNDFLTSVPKPGAEAEQVSSKENFDTDTKNKETYNFVNEVGSFDSDDILNLIRSKDADGFSPTVIYAVVQKLHNVKPGMGFDDVADEDREFVDDLTIGDCAIDIFSVDSEITNLVFDFKTKTSVYIREITDFFNRYRILGEKMNMIAAETNSDSMVIPVMTVALMPKDLQGIGSVTFSFPITMMRTLDDNGENCQVHMLFHSDSVSFQKLLIDDESKTDLEAEILREMEGSTGGQIF